MEPAEPETFRIVVTILFFVVAFLVVRAILKRAIVVPDHNENPGSEFEHGASTLDTRSVAEETLALNKELVSQGEETIALSLVPRLCLGMQIATLCVEDTADTGTTQAAG